eukprot:c24162_g1_i2 orf=511-2697(+)
MDSSCKKLLVLDVNGLLVDTYFRADRRPGEAADTRIGNFFVYKRPFCDEFLKFCLENFVVGIWSSAKRQKVDSLVDFIFRDSKVKLAFSWCQLNCTDTGMKAPENMHKPLFLKELSKLWGNSNPGLPWKGGDYGPINTLLVDDTPYKAIRNPPNTAIFLQSYSAHNRKDNVLGGTLRVYLEFLSSAANVQQFVENNPFGEPSITPANPQWRYLSRLLITEKFQVQKADEITRTLNADNRPRNGTLKIQDMTNASENERVSNSRKGDPGISRKIIVDLFADNSMIGNNTLEVNCRDMQVYQQNQQQDFIRHANLIGTRMAVGAFPLWRVQGKGKWNHPQNWWKKQSSIYPTLVDYLRQNDYTLGRMPEVHPGIHKQSDRIAQHCLAKKYNLLTKNYSNMPSLSKDHIERGRSSHIHKAADERHQGKFSVMESVLREKATALVSKRVHVQKADETTQMFDAVKHDSNDMLKTWNVIINSKNKRASDSREALGMSKIVKDGLFAAASSSNDEKHALQGNSQEIQMYQEHKEDDLIQYGHATEEKGEVGSIPLYTHRRNRWNHPRNWLEKQSSIYPGSVFSLKQTHCTLYRKPEAHAARHAQGVRTTQKCKVKNHRSLNRYSNNSLQFSKDHVDRASGSHRGKTLDERETRKCENMSVSASKIVQLQKADERAQTFNVKYEPNNNIPTNVKDLTAASKNKRSSKSQKGDSGKSKKMKINLFSAVSNGEDGKF